MYAGFFGLSERPFTLLPDPDFLYWSRGHMAAHAVLEYGLATHAPLTVLTGEIGTGKTTLVQNLIAAIDDTTTVGLLSNGARTPEALLRWIAHAFGLTAPAGADQIALHQMIQDFLLEEYGAGRRVVLIVDEAQTLSPDTLEELRMLTNINAGKHDLLQLILVGQPELRDRLALPQLRQIAQRVVAAHHLGALDARLVGDYIAHRMRAAGGTGEEFLPEAAARLAELSQGVPRVLNKLCELCLVYAADAETRTIGRDIVDQILADGLVLDLPGPRSGGAAP